MTNKSRRISVFIAPFEGKDRDARYLAYFDLFNRQMFFEAHDMLEELWLAGKGAPNHTFYKGLIQLAGGFVHLQKGRLRPAASVFNLAVANLHSYAPLHEGLEVGEVLKVVGELIHRLNGGQFQRNPLVADGAPKLRLSELGVVNVTRSRYVKKRIDRTGPSG
jgi:predicted metal-dependent hydrolase